MSGVSSRLYKPRFIYFVEDLACNLYKVGSTSKDPLIRLASLRVGNPDGNLRLAGVCTGSWLHEREFHQRFAQHKHRGEWYKPFPELLTFLETLPSGGSYADGADVPRLAAVADSMVLMRDRGYTYEQIGEFFGVSRQAVFQNVNGRTTRVLPRGGRTREARIESPTIADFYMNRCSDHSVLTLEA